MSKCPLQIYLNDKYLESSPSVQTSNNVLKRTFRKCRESGLFNTQKYRGSSLLENDKCKVINKSIGYKHNTILQEYLAEHSKSVAAYYSLQKQQEEVLNLCKQKIAKRFPSSVRAVLKDEDIIKALRIAENSDNNLVENKKSGDRLVHAVLNAIMSNVSHQIDRTNNCNDNLTCQKEDKQFQGDYFGPKKKSVFSKFVNFFAKPDTQKAYLTASDNYFNNSKYIINSSAMGVVPYSGKTDELTSYSKHGRKKKKKFKYRMDKFAGDTCQAENMESDTSSSYSLTLNNSQKRKRSTNYLTYYCTYQRDVDYLKSEIEKQKNEIKSIQKNLSRCLNILRAFEDRGNKDNFFKNNASTYPVLTQNECRGYCNPAEPYGRYYPQYRAETDAGYDGRQSSSNGRSNSSNEVQRKKCCSCSQKKGKKHKGKKKKRKTKEINAMQSQTPPNLCDCTKSTICQATQMEKGDTEQNVDGVELQLVNIKPEPVTEPQITATYYTLPPHGYSKGTCSCIEKENANAQTCIQRSPCVSCLQKENKAKRKSLACKQPQPSPCFSCAEKEKEKNLPICSQSQRSSYCSCKETNPSSSTCRQPQRRSCFISFCKCLFCRSCYI